MGDDVNENDYQNSKHIPGIYNYCDRWCERCPFTSRCLNFEMSSEKFGDLESVDLTNKAFWEKLGETLHETMLMLKEMAAEKGIDLDAIDLEEEQMIGLTREKTVVHMTAHLAKSYISVANNWFESNIYIYEDDEDIVDAMSASGSVLINAEINTTPLVDAVEVIRWYQHQMYVKLERAYHSSQDEEFEILNDFPKDSDGSAKVALLGMDRSISAWGKIIKFFPEQKEAILGIIAHLERLRKCTEVEFPDARSFIRPGFDEINPEAGLSRH